MTAMIMSVWRRTAVITIAAVALIPFFAENARASDNVIKCSFHKTDGLFTGDCSVPCLVNNLLIDMAGPKPGATCTAPDRTVKATLSRTDNPKRFLGAMPGKFPEDPTRFELILTDGSSGIAKTPFGWFAASVDLSNDHTMKLLIAANRQLPPTNDDILILRRALDMLPNETAWNRHDTRECPPHPRTRSLFCALHDATVETTGGLHYRQPALQAARQEVNKVFDDVKKHRLMEFNNSPKTTLKDVRLVLMRAQEDIQRDLRR